MGRAFDPAFRAEALRKLSSLTPSELQSMQSQRGAGLGIQPEAYGSSQADLVFTPVTPCRIIDTRVAGGPVNADSQRNFIATGTNFSTQGGFSGDCGVPVGPTTAVVVNLVAVGPAGGGDLRAFPFGTTVPLASVLNYANVPMLNIANQILVAICDPSVSTCTSDFTVQADVSATDLVGDVMGYFKLLPPGGRAFATIRPGASPSIDTSLPNKNIQSVRSVTTGVYCVLPVSSLGSPSTLPMQVQVEWGDSIGSSLVAMIFQAAGDCLSTEIEVRTVDLTAASSANVAFQIFIP